MSFLKEYLSRPLNYTCVYDERKNRIVAVPRTSNPSRHVMLTLLFVAVTVCLAAGMRMSVIWMLNAAIPGDSYPWWATALDSTASALVLVIMFVSVSPRLGMFPGFLGGKLVLTDSAVDKKLATLVQKNPRRLNVDWFKEWYGATAHQQETMWQQMKEALEKTDKKVKKQNRAKVQKVTTE